MGKVYVLTVGYDYEAAAHTTVVFGSFESAEAYQLEREAHSINDQYNFFINNQKANRLRSWGSFSEYAGGIASTVGEWCDIEEVEVRP